MRSPECEEAGAALSNLLAGATTPDELSRLSAHQTGCPDCRAQIERLLWQDRALGELAGASLAETLRARIHLALRARPPEAAHQFSFRALVAAACVLAAAGAFLFWVLGDSRTSGAVARMEGLHGQVFVTSKDSEEIAAEGTTLISGKGVKLIGEASRAVVTFPDGSALELAGQTVIGRISDTRLEEPGEPGSEQQVFVTQGSLHARVAKQAPGRSMVFSSPDVVVRVIGTALRFDVAHGTTRVDVDEGSVRVTRSVDGKAVDLQGGQFAVAAPGVELVAQPQPRLPPRGKTFTDITRECGLEALRNQKPANWWLSGVHLVDLTGNGHLDFFMSGHGGGSLAALNDGKGVFTPVAGTLPDTEIHLPYDTTETGRVNLSMTYQDGGGRWWLNHSTPGKLNFQAGPVMRDGGGARQQALIDINRDGRVDWLRGAGAGVLFDYGNGNGGFEEKSFTLPNPGSDGITVIPVDLDGDGFIDLIVQWGRYDYEPGRTRIYHNDGKMNFTDVTKEVGLYEDGLVILGVGDVNQDGHVDLIALEQKTFPHTIFLNDGTGKFKKLEGAVTGDAGKATYASWGMAVMTDLDNDGIPDLLVTGRNYLKVLRGTGGGRFTYMNKEWSIRDTAEAAVDSGFAFGDLDGDGALDLIGYREIHPNKSFSVYRNDLPAKNWVRVRPIGAPGNTGAAGSKIRLTAAGTKELLWYEQVAIYCKQAQQSYYSFAETERHFGLGSRPGVDVSVEFYPSGKVVKRSGVKANTTVRISESE